GRKRHVVPVVYGGKKLPVKSRQAFGRQPPKSICLPSGCRGISHGAVLDKWRGAGSSQLRGWEAHSILRSS
ncbi:MAG: hypothetical protein ACRC2V_20870, partial [Xenococcaceae cyanobacterium]